MKTLKTCRLLYSKFYMHKKGKALEEKTVYITGMQQVS